MSDSNPTRIHPSGRPAAAELLQDRPAAEWVDPGRVRITRAIERARAALLARQAGDGSWCFPLEADCTIPAEHVLWRHFTGEVDRALERKLAAFLRERQADHGGWPLYHRGRFDLSCSVKAYWALKLSGDDPGAPHMVRARDAILARGGAARANVFTRIALALFGHLPWRGVPFVPVEIVLLPRWFPFHLSKVSYWSRTVMVPLSVLCSLKARAANPTGLGVRELFATDPERERRWFTARSRANRALLAIERAARRLEPLIPGFVRRRALARAEEWIVARLNGPHGLGGIFPAMVNAHEALGALGHPLDHPLRLECREAIDRLLVDEGERAWCQPCVSPVWDTALAALALEETQAVAPEPETGRAIDRALDWLAARQIQGGPADWREARPDLAPGGWAFQYENPWYPDLDDTAAVVWAMAQRGEPRFDVPMARAVDWLAGMQSKNGGFASFDADNTSLWLNEIPFADHGALLDPPTADVSARCALAFALLDREEDRPARERCLRFLLDEQEDFGGWYGRWGTNYVYGTWSVLAALEHSDDPRAREAARRGADWLKSVQRPDGSWGEGNDTYWEPERAGRGPEGTAFQTAWALLALFAAKEGGSPAVRRGVEHLLRTQQPDGLWREPWYTAPGFPRVFHLLYHGYAAYFPLWALARCRRHLEGRAG